MFFALDEQGNRIHADSATKGKLACPLCGKPVRHKKGKIKRWHFAHLPDSNCPFANDKDYNHEWHIRMQEYFPIESRERIFVDKETNEKHIADVFLKDANIVLEFQHSPISGDEFLSRTNFHIKEGRRIVWLFDESEKAPKPEHIGRFKRTGLQAYANAPYRTISPYILRLLGDPYEDHVYRWLNSPRKCLNIDKPLETLADRLAICVYTGLEGDCFHRIQHIQHETNDTTVTFSLHDIVMKEDMQIEEFFIPEQYWQQQPPHKVWFESFYGALNGCIKPYAFIKQKQQVARTTQWPRPTIRRKKRF